MVHLIDHHYALPSQIKAARSGRKAATDETVMRDESARTFGEASTPLEAGLTEKAAKPRCGPRQALLERRRPCSENEATPE